MLLAVTKSHEPLSRSLTVDHRTPAYYATIIPRVQVVLKIMVLFWVP